MNEFDTKFGLLIRQFAPEAEVVADLLKGHNRRKNADYFFRNRGFIVELKCLEEEKYGALHDVMQGLLDKGEIGMFYKGMSVKEVIKGHPEKENIYTKLFKVVSSSLHDALENANRQIRETRKSFGLKAAMGVAVIVNRNNAVLDPKLAQKVVRSLMDRKNAAGTYRYEELSIVIFTSDVHFLTPVKPNDAAMPFIVTSRNESFSVSEMSFVQEFADLWCQFRGVPVMRLDRDSLESAAYASVKDLEELHA
jgi:hypothetical protein